MSKPAHSVSTLSTLAKNFNIKTFFFFPRIQDLTFHAPMETICRKCQILFLGINKKNNIITLLSAEFAHRQVKVNESVYEG